MGIEFHSFLAEEKGKKIEIALVSAIERCMERNAMEMWRKFTH